MLIIHQIELYI